MPGMLHVTLGERLVGTLTNLGGDYNLFAFDDSYIDDGNRPVLSRAFIGQGGELMVQVPRTLRVAPPFFANLLPELPSVLRGLVARQYGIDEARDYPFLDALGRDLPGAVVLRGHDSSVEAIEPSPLVDSPAGDAPLRFSLAGVQPKFSAGFVRERLTVPMSGLGGSWIVKLPTNAFARLPENEYVVMSLAKAAGLNVPEIMLVPLEEVDGLPRDLARLRTDEPAIAYAIRRFDRSPAGRVHCEDFNQIANQAPREKYDNHDSEWIAQVVTTLCPPEDSDELVRRLVFGVLVGNGDMHLKNWSLQYPDGRRARLSPMYDFVCVRAYYENGELALPIAGLTRFSQID